MNPHHSIPADSRLQVGQLTCWVEGAETPKVVGHPQTEKEGNIFSCWIESVAGQEFTINWHNNHREHPLEGRLYIDGVLCDTRYMPDRNHKPDAFWSTVVMDCAQISDHRRGSFLFSDLQDVQDDEVEDNDQDRCPDVFQIGTIRLEVRRIQLANHHPTVYNHNVGKSLCWPLANDVAELVPHRTRLGKEYEHPQRSLIGAKAKSLDHNPWYTFIFNYRPLYFLLKYNLMPLWYTTPQQTTGLEESLVPTRPYGQLQGSSSHSITPALVWSTIAPASSTKRKRDEV